MESLPSESVRPPQDPVHTAAVLRCPMCQKRAVRVGRLGRTAPYRNMRVLRVPESVRLPQCTRCKHEWIDQRGREELLAALPAVFEEALKRRVRAAIDALCPLWISQRQLEDWLGLSQGYLSRLRAGAGVPSPELVSNLAILAMDPRPRLAELRRYWSEMDPVLGPAEVSR